MKEPKKPRTPKNLLSETVVDIKTDLPTAISRLQQMNGSCRDTLEDEFPLLFHSDKKGRFAVYESTRGGRERSTRVVFLSGGLYAEEGQTKGVVHVTHSKSVGVSNYVLAGVYSVMAVLSLVLGALSLRQNFSQQQLMLAVLSVVLWGAMAVMQFVRSGRSIQSTDTDATVMEREALRRLQAIDEWEK